MRRTSRTVLALVALVGLLFLAASPALGIEEFGRERPTDFLIPEVDDTVEDGIRINVVPPTGIEDLAPEDIRVEVNGGPVEVLSTERGQPAVPQATVVVVDNSTAAVEDFSIASIRAAAEAAITGLPNESLVAIVTSGGEPRVLVPFTADRAAALAALEALAAEDGTARWDALDEAVGLLEDAPVRFGNIAVFALSPDTRSQVTEVEIRTAVVDDDHSFFAIGPESLLAGDLTRVVDSAGGAALAASSPESLLSGATETAGVLTERTSVLVERPENLPTSGLVEATFVVGDRHVDLSFGAGRITRGHGQITTLITAEPPADAGVLSSSLMKWLGALLALGAVGLAAYAIGMVFMRDQSELNRALQLYSDEYEGDSVDDDENQSALGSSAVLQRAVELTGSIAERRGMLSRVSGLLEQSDIPLRPAEAIFFALSVTVIGTILAFAFGGFLWAFIVGLALLIIQPMILKYTVTRRQRKFEAALPDMLQLVAGTLKAGYSLLQGIGTVSEQIDGPMGEELRRVMTEAQLGRELEDALEGVGERMDSDDFRWAVMAIRIQREVGGNLAELLLTVAETMTGRERLRREINALTAEGRVSAIVLGALPLGLGVIMYFLNPDYIGLLLTERAGNIALVGAVLLALAGFAWMKKIINIDI